MACADLALDALSGEYEVVRLPPNAAVPPDLFSSAPADALVSVTRTADELSLLRPAAGAVIPALKVRGPLPFELVGVLARLTVILARADISIFATSTYDTDYLLVKETKLAAAAAALTAAGATVAGVAPPKKEKKKKKKKKAPILPDTLPAPPAAPRLTGEASLLNDCFENYKPEEPAEEDDAMARAFNAAPRASAGLAGDLQHEFSSLVARSRVFSREVVPSTPAEPSSAPREVVSLPPTPAEEPPQDTSLIISPAPAAPLDLRPPPARYPAAALSAKPTTPLDPAATPVVDRRFLPEAYRLAEAFGTCADAPLQPATPAPPPAIEAAPRPPAALEPTGPVSVTDAFGECQNGRGPANGWAMR